MFYLPYPSGAGMSESAGVGVIPAALGVRDCGPDDVDPPVSEMAYEKPLYSLNQVDKAGEAIVRGAEPDSPEWLKALPIFWNWRSAHAYPQNAFYVTLHRRAKAISEDATISQRLKRRESIVRKLWKNQKMELSQMQDIAGCRAVMPTMADVRALLENYRAHPVRSQLVRSTDYIASPRQSGYRGVHLMYRFNGRASSAPWNKLRVELQIRTALQHSWATAVEAVDLFTNQQLKSEVGSSDWLEFFALVAGINAFQEGTAPVPGLSEGIDYIVDDLRALNARLHAIETLDSFGRLASVIEAGYGAYWYLVVTNPREGNVSVYSYTKQELAEAELHYQKLEENAEIQAVLVSADSVLALRRAYPAYFADTMAFVINIRDALDGKLTAAA
ncbi:MAG TPA: RelA/SpoT domain-containing protein [Alphaproteobacteria bacterium]|nr:RelA/SpoT domain-containing protein [Alphaproteobacteria bacterium]